MTNTERRHEQNHCKTEQQQLLDSRLFDNSNNALAVMILLSPQGAYLSETILKVGSYLMGGLFKFRGPQIYQRQYFVSFFNIKYFDFKCKFRMDQGGESC